MRIGREKRFSRGLKCRCAGVDAVRAFPVDAELGGNLIASCPSRCPTTIAIDGGSSGSPVFDADGRLDAPHHAGGEPKKLASVASV